MLILPNGHGAWEQRMQSDECSGTLDQATYSETGFAAKTGALMDYHIQDSTLRWDIPWSFCPHCCPAMPGRAIDRENAENGAPGIFLFDEPRPDLDVRPGHVIKYNTCGECRQHNIWGGKPKLIYPTGGFDRFQRTVQQRVQDGIVSWIKNAQLRGIKPLED